MYLLLLAACTWIDDADWTRRVSDMDLDGYVSVEAGGGDCDDTDPGVHPGAPEICGDHVLNGCSATDPGCRPRGVRPFEEADVIWTGDQPGDRLGNGVAVTATSTTVAVGIPYRSPTGAPRAGAVLLYRPPFADVLGPDDAVATWLSAEPDTFAGATLTATDDLDGDGVEDLGVGAWSLDRLAEDAGAFWVLPTDLDGVHDLDEASALVAGDEAGDALTLSPPWSGDATGDGQADLVVSATPRLGFSGNVWLLAGPLRGDVSLQDATLTVTGESGSSLGSCNGGGDLDGDGQVEIVAGAQSASSGDGSRPGAAYLFDVPGSATLASEDARAVIWGDADGDLMGYRVTTPGDVDGDGRGDLLVTGLGTDRGGRDAGAVYLFPGPIMGAHQARDAAVRWDGTGPGAGLLLDTRAAGDLDADGYLDLAFTEGPTSNAETGAVHVVFGPPAGASLEDAFSIRASSAADGLGYTVVAGRDLDGDGYGDLLAGAFGWGASEGVDGPGALGLFRGTGP